MFTTQPTTSPVPFGFWPNHVNNFHQAGVDHQEWAAMYTITKTENHSCSAIKITRSHNICRWKRTTNSSLKALNMTKQWYPTGSEHPEEKQSKGPDVCVFVCRQQKAEIPSQHGPSMVSSGDRTLCASPEPLTPWLIPIYSLHYSSYSLLSLLQIFLLSSATHLMHYHPTYFLWPVFTLHSLRLTTHHIINVQ